MQNTNDVKHFWLELKNNPMASFCALPARNVAKTPWSRLDYVSERGILGQKCEFSGEEI